VELYLHSTSVFMMWHFIKLKDNFIFFALCPVTFYFPVPFLLILHFVSYSHFSFSILFLFLISPTSYFYFAFSFLIIHPLRCPCDTLYPQKLALTSPASGGRSVGIVHLWTKATKLIFLFIPHYSLSSWPYLSQAVCTSLC
jgi:hypothetical protein